MRQSQRTSLIASGDLEPYKKNPFESDIPLHHVQVKTFHIYECHSAMCRGEMYATTNQPLSCPYCDSTATEEKPFKKIMVNVEKEYRK